MGLEVSSAPGRGEVFLAMEEGLGTGLQDGLFLPPMGKGMSQGRGKEEAD